MDASFVNWNNSENNFLVNPRWPSEIQEFFKKGTQEIISEHNIEASLFIPTSGTTAKDLRGLGQEFEPYQTIVALHYPRANGN